jgi:REP element-mobilizing transposase RayT
VTILRQSPRLKHFDYRGHHAYFVTTVTRERQPIFNDRTILDLATSILVRAAQGFDFEISAYCFMPDHLQILAAGKSQGSNLKEFIRQFKQRTSFHAKRIAGAELWQISYYDRVLRNSEAIEDVARYIWANPMRAELVDDYREWPGLGPRPLPDLA